MTSQLFNSPEQKYFNKKNIIFYKNKQKECETVSGVRMDSKKWFKNIKISKAQPHGTLNVNMHIKRPSYSKYIMPSKDLKWIAIIITVIDTVS